MRTNFFERPAPVLPTKTLNLPVFGEVVLEKMDYAKTMKYRSLAEEKIQYYSVHPFPLIGDKAIDITDAWANTAAIAHVMQIQDDPYSFEELIAASVTDEEEYNTVISAVNDLNLEVEEDPKEQ